MKKILSGTVFLAILLLAIIITVSGCKKAEETPITYVPVVITQNIVAEVGQTTAKSGGVVYNNNGSEILSLGVCWSATNQTPTVADSKTTDALTYNEYTSSLTGLTANTTYYVRAYATSASGTGYGNVITFKTNATAAQITANVTTIAGSAATGKVDGPGTSALFDGPEALAFNPVTGNLYIGDTFNNSIRTMTTTGTVATLTNGTLGFANGSLASALFYGPKGFAFDAQGNTYVADMGNSLIRKITPGGVVSTFTGLTVPGYVDGDATVAKFNNPVAAAVDATGNVYIADRSNNVIRKSTSAGVVATLAGYPGSIGSGFVDAVGANAKFKTIAGIAINAAGTKLYVADRDNNAIRVVNTADATVTTLAGHPLFPDLIGSPVALAIDAQDNLFITDQRGRIFEITAAGVLYKLAGTLTPGNVNGAGAAARFNNPQGIAKDAAGNVYVADYGNNTIRKIAITIQ
jgi:DNA-binding beta-propeller fold protein YncE